MRLPKLAAALCVLALGCHTQDLQAKTKPEIEREAPENAKDVAAIQKLRARDVAASKAGDFQTLKELFTDDAVVMPPGTDFVRGREKLGANLDQMRETMTRYKVLDYKEEFEELKIYGKEAIEWGQINGKMQDTRTGKVEVSAFKVMRILRKQPNGEWKIARSIYNDMPAKE